MDVTGIFTHNFQKKIVSILVAIVIWAVVSKSITTTRVFTRVPIRVVNIPADQTIRGLMPNNILNRKLTLTLSGTKNVIDRLEPQDFEVVIDAADKGHEWIVQVGKKNLVSLNPDIDLIRNVTQVSHSEFLLQLCPLITEKVPVYILPPRGEPPEGYQFLDVWPQKVYHTISGPEEDVKILQEQGLEVTFDLSNISKEELDHLSSQEEDNNDEVSFAIPENWKKIEVPFLNNLPQDINGAEARQLRINFVKKDLLPLDRPIPVRLFYPLSTITTINPTTLKLLISQALSYQDQVPVISKTLFAAGVSRLFLDIVKDRLEVVILPPQGNEEFLRWGVQFIDPRQLEETYVTLLFTTSRDGEIATSSLTTSSLAKQHQVQREQLFRLRFREYMERFQLYAAKAKPFKLQARVMNGSVVVEEGK